MPNNKSSLTVPPSNDPRTRLVKQLSGQEDEPLVVFTSRLPRSLKEDLRLISVLEDVKMEAVLAAALREYISARPKLADGIQRTKSVRFNHF